MWPFAPRRPRAVVVIHIDQFGLAKGAWFNGDAEVLVIDDRDPRNRVYRMTGETDVDTLRRKIGRHPLGRLLGRGGDETEISPAGSPGAG